ncbi:MAG: hypothetical protein LW832_08020 [Parachlamydia sp.]|jgi:hypothetical protein|nr:hypothetical protein [Parachlamydia sp.]
MLPINILEKTDNCIIYELPAGKLSPDQPCSLDGERRQRVFQPAYKGNTCWYYTLNFLRNRIGKQAPDGFSKERKIEKLCSERRKQQTLFENSLPAIADQLKTEMGLKMLGSIISSFLPWAIMPKAYSRSIFLRKMDIGKWIGINLIALKRPLI